MKQRARGKVLGIVGMLAVTVLAVFLGAFHLTGWARFDGPINKVAIDLGQPDGLIVTRSLSSLPRDLLRVPLLKDLLSEDFVFYYEHNEDRLGLVGSLRRIAYEHQLEWQDRLLDLVFDEPAELAFWRNAKGSAEYSLLAMTRNSLAKIVQQLANIALKDQQLSLATQISVGGKELPVYALRYGRDRAVLIVSKGERVVVLSEPGMLLSQAGEADPRAVAMVARLLDEQPATQQLYRRAFALPDGPATHRVALAANFLSFGYQHFFPGLQALRFDFGAGGWSTHARLNDGVAKLLPVGNTSRALPARPAACSWLPVAWPLAEKLLGRANGAPPLPSFSGPGAVCWYANSELHTPVFVAELAKEPDTATDQALQQMFAWAVVGEEEADAALDTNLDPAAKAGPGAGKVEKTDAAEAWVKQRRNKATSYVPSFGRRGRVVVFSPDYELVQRALATLDRRYPSVADSLPATGGASTLAVLTPKSLGQLAQQAVFEVLPKAEHPILHDAVQTHLPARLKAIGKYPAYRLALLHDGGAPDNWHPVRWDELTAQP